MKKILFSFMMFSLALFTACSSDTENQDPNNNGEEIDVTITAEVPSLSVGTTKSTFALPADINSAKGGVSNVDPGAHKLRYILEITNTTGTATTIQHVQAVSIDGISKVSFTARLVKGATYQFVAWADFTKTATPLVDNHYITADLKAIKLTATSAQIVNDDSKDAYFANEEIVAKSTIMKMTLKRPFGKVRFIATDYGQFVAAGSTLNSVTHKHTQKSQQYTTFDAYSGAVGDLTTTFVNVPAPMLTVSDLSNVGNEKTLYWDYLFAPTAVAPPAVAAAAVAFNLTQVTTLHPSGFTIYFGPLLGITAERNKLTTIKQAIFTGSFAIELEVSDNFDGGIDIGSGAFSIGNTYYTTLAAAIIDAKVGETINVGEGTFAGDFTIPKGVKLEGKGRETIFTGVITVIAGAQLKDVTSYYNGPLRNAVELEGENIIIDGVTFITDRRRGIAPDPYNGEAMHGGKTVKNLTIQGCTFNELGGVSNYWKGIYLNENYGLKVINNTFNNIIPFGIDHFNEPMVVTGNTFQRNSSIGDTQMIHIADGNIPDEGKDINSWPAGLLQNVKDIKEKNIWEGKFLSGDKCHPVRVKVWYAGGEYDATWVFRK